MPPGVDEPLRRRVDRHYARCVEVLARLALDGSPVERRADLHNRNRWEVSGDRFTARDGEELSATRTIDGRPLSDDVDPWGFGAWARHRRSTESS